MKERKVYLTSGENGKKLYVLAPQKVVAIEGIEDGNVIVRRRSGSMDIEGMNFHYLVLDEMFDDVPLEEMHTYNWPNHLILNTEDGTVTNPSA